MGSLECLLEGATFNAWRTTYRSCLELGPPLLQILTTKIHLWIISHHLLTIPLHLSSLVLIHVIFTSPPLKLHLSSYIPGTEERHDPEHQHLGICTSSSVESKHLQIIMYSKFKLKLTTHLRLVTPFCARRGHAPSFFCQLTPPHYFHHPRHKAATARILALRVLDWK